MSAYNKEPITEGYVGRYPNDNKWHKLNYVYPNFGPFYNSYKAARREVGERGQVFKVTVTYEEVTE